jgi:hypothetical protein
LRLFASINYNIIQYTTYKSIISHNNLQELLVKLLLRLINYRMLI